MTRGAVRYSAFISYNHRDAKFAAWLLKQLEGYHVPPRIQGRETALGVLGSRLPPVFRDREELSASSDLAASVRDALDDSASLIVICSPSGAQSRWVNEEIRYFTALGRRNRVQCLIVGGIPNASRLPGFDASLECLPEALFENDGREPLAADIRPGHDGRQVALLKLVAGLIGVGYDELAQREAQRRQRRLLLALGASTAGSVAMAGLAAFAFVSRAEAVKQRDIARQKSITAERTVEFVKSMFRTSDPSEAQGQTVTVREMLDAGARRIAADLADEPNVKAELTATLGEVYGGLGLYREGNRILGLALGMPGVDAAVRARQFAVLGETLTQQGDYPAAVAAHRKGLAALDSTDAQAELQARLLLGLGEGLSSLEQYDEAEASIRRALELERGRVGPEDPAVARALETLSLNAFFAGDLAEAQAHMQQALTIRLARQGERHPKVSEDLNMLGSIAYELKQPEAAEQAFRRALASDAAVLGPDHPDTARTANNLARVILERQGYAEARGLLKQAIAVNLRERAETHDDMAYLFGNLAQAEQGLGNLAEADRQFQKAWAAADLHRHRNRGPILAYRAEIACVEQRTAEGLALLRKAEPLTLADYPDDPWRTAWIGAVRAGCLAAAGDRAGARKLLEAAGPAIRARWGAGSLYAERLRLFETRAAT